MGNPLFTRIFFRGSRTYFFSSIFFPEDLRNDVFTLYSFVRKADDFVDSIPQQQAAFEKFRREYLDCLNGKPSEEIIITEFVNLIRKHHFPTDWVEAFLNAMESDLHFQPYQHLSQLEHYMYGSAEVIGLMMAQMMGLPKQSHDSAKLLGKSMQYINFIRDVAEDNALGRQYIPQEQLNEFGLQNLTLEHVQRHQEQFTACVQKQIETYRVWEKSAREGLVLIPRQYRSPIQTANDMYRWTAEQIYQNPMIVYKRKIKPSPPRILFSGTKITLSNAISK